MKPKNRQAARVEAVRWQAELARLAVAQHYAAGVRLFRQNEPVRDVYVIAQGLVKLVYQSRGGCELILGLRAEWRWLGDEAAVLREPVGYSAITQTECELYRLPVAAYQHWLNRDLQFAQFRHEEQSRALVAHMRQAVDLVCASARQRLEQALWQMAQASAPNERNVKLQLPLQQQELACLIAVTPAHLSRLFNNLEHDQLARRDRGWLVIPAPDKLWRR